MKKGEQIYRELRHDLNSGRAFELSAGEVHGVIIHGVKTTLGKPGDIAEYSICAQRKAWPCGRLPPGEVLVTEDAYKAISAAFPGAMRAEYLLKGISRPVATNRMVRDPSAMTQAAKAH